MDEWTADEEVGGLLDNEEEEEDEYDTYVVGKDVVEMEDWTSEAEAYSRAAEPESKPLPLPPAPPPVPPKGEPSRS